MSAGYSQQLQLLILLEVIVRLVLICRTMSNICSIIYGRLTDIKFSLLPQGIRSNTTQSPIGLWIIVLNSLNAMESAYLRSYGVQP
jgi:hypothetical protein